MFSKGCKFWTREVVHGPLKRDHIGTDDLAMVVKHLIHLFEIPLYTSGHAALRPEEIKNSFVVFRVSSLCADLWKDMTKDFAGKNKKGQPFNYAQVYLSKSRQDKLGASNRTPIQTRQDNKRCGQVLGNGERGLCERQEKVVLLLSLPSFLLVIIGYNKPIVL